MSRFDEIYAKHAGAVFHYALKCVGRRDVAEDITSEVFLTLHRTIDSIDVEQLPRWLFTVAKNRAVDHWRRAHVEQKVPGRAGARRGDVGTFGRSLVARSDRLETGSPRLPDPSLRARNDAGRDRGAARPD